MLKCQPSEMASQGMDFTLVGGPSQLCWLKCRVVTLLLFFDLLEIETDIKTNLPDMKTTLPEIKTDLPGIKTALPEIKTDLPGIKTDLPEINTDLPGIKTALPEIEIFLYELDNK